MKNATTTKQQAGSSEWAPLHIATFRAIWFASLAANIGAWFQNVGGVWLMTHFTTSPVLIALMQTATTLPVFLVGLLAGALANIVNRRRLPLATEGLILVAASALALLTYTGLMNAPLLLGLTFILGLGAILVDQLDPRCTMPFDADDGGATTREQSLDRDVRDKIIQQRHPQPTSFPAQYASIHRAQANILWFLNGL